MTAPDLAGLCERLRTPSMWQSFSTTEAEPEIRRDPFEAAAAIESLVAALETIRDRPGPSTHYTKGVGEQPIDEAAHMAATGTGLKAALRLPPAGGDGGGRPKTSESVIREAVRVVDRVGLTRAAQETGFGRSTLADWRKAVRQIEGG